MRCVRQICLYRVGRYVKKIYLRVDVIIATNERDLKCFCIKFHFSVLLPQRGQYIVMLENFISLMSPYLIRNITDGVIVQRILIVDNSLLVHL